VRLARAIGVIGLIGFIGMVDGCASGGGYTPETYVVRPQDTLYSIAWRHDLDYHELARWNNIGSNYRITIGQILMLRPPARAPAEAPPARTNAPVPARSSPPPPARTGSPAPAKQAEIWPPAGTPPAPTPPPTAAATLPPASDGGSTRWTWPTEHASPPRPVPGGGILLLGQLGQPVRAACSGHVVYVGNGLRGYGNLIIIKHGENLLSAYAHTRDLAVHEGQDVVAGQPIAQMGTGAHQIPALYFEIRLNGKPVDPLLYLAGAK
jgi:lipoprotein NlpD